MGRSPGRRVGYAHPPAAGQSPAAGSQRGQGPAAPPPRRTGLPGGRRGGGGVLRVWGPVGPRPAKPTQGAGAKGPRPLRCARCARPPPPPSARVFHRRQKKAAKPLTFQPIRPRAVPHPEKAAATANRSEGVYNRAGEPSEPFPAPPRATVASQPRPLLRDYRRPRRTA